MPSRLYKRLLARNLLRLGLLLGLVVGWSGPEAIQGRGLYGEAPAPFVAGEITVGVGEDFVFAANDEVFGLPLLGVYPMSGHQVWPAHGDAPASTTHTLLLQVTPGHEEAEIARVSSLPGVHFALPNWTAYAAATEPVVQVLDPLYESEQWYLQRVQAARGWGLAHVQAGGLPQLRRVRVAVIDSGVDFSHPELMGKLLPGWNYVTPGAAPQDDFGHGTHITGLIAAHFNNGRGIVGLAPVVEILPYRALNSEGTGSLVNVADAIRAAANSNARVINLSLYLNNPHPLLEDAVRHAHSQGALLIAAAGNCVAGLPCPTPVRYPAAYPEVMAVAATTIHDARANYSAVGPELDLAAPGGDAAARILSLWPLELATRCGAQSLRIELGAAYCYSTGTSSAAALVSGAAALLMSAYPDLHGNEARAVLIETAHPLAQGETDVGAGRLDLRAALRMAFPAELTISPSYLTHVVYPPRAEATGAPETRTMAPLLPPAPITRTVRLENPSLAPVDWVATVVDDVPWLRLYGPTSGQARFESPGHLTLVYSPTTSLQGRLHTAAVRIEARRLDGTRIVQTIPVYLDVLAPDQPWTLMSAAHGLPGARHPLAVDYRWETPGPGHVRAVHGMTDHSVMQLSLPFPVTFKGRTYTDLRLASDGYVSLPGGETEPGPANRCLPNLTHPALVIAGWWTDLNPGIGPSRISTFVGESGAFVVEYLNLALAARPAEQVSFQIVLDPAGEIRLSYAQTPGQAFLDQHRPPVTVGVAAQYGRFYRQIYCSRGAVATGQLPRSGETYRLAAGDIQ